MRFCEEMITIANALAKTLLPEKPFFTIEKGQKGKLSFRRTN